MATLDMLRSCSLYFWFFFSIFYNIFDGAPLLHTINQPIKFNNFHFDVQYLSKYFEKYSNDAYFFLGFEGTKNFKNHCAAALRWSKHRSTLVACILICVLIWAVRKYWSAASKKYIVLLLVLKKVQYFFHPHVHRSRGCEKGINIIDQNFQ